MPFSPVPKRIYSSIFDLRPADLRAEGVRMIFADLDNTLARYGQREPSPELIEWKDELSDAGIRLFIVSNNRKPTRAAEFSTALGIDFIGHAGKPKRAGFLQALERTGFTTEETVMIGDQIFTDMLGANNAGIRSWLVMPIRLDSMPRRIRFAAEGPFRVLCPDDRRTKNSRIHTCQNRRNSI